MKKPIIILLFILIINLTSAIRINEIELNPPGNDAGAEWIELYCEKQTSLQDCKIKNNDGDEKQLDGTCSGYLIINFEKQWLDNKDEKVFLYNGDDLIDETGLFLDSANNDKTQQFCDEWVFADSTKAEENNCNIVDGGDTKDTDDVEEDKQDDEKNKDDAEIQTLINTQTTNPTKNIINLNSQEESTNKPSNTVYQSKSEKIKKYTIYFFALFLVFVIVVLVLRR